MVERSLQDRAGVLRNALGRRGVSVDRVVVTNNRVRLASRHRRAGRVIVRVSSRLLEVGEGVIEPLAGFFADDADAKASLTKIIDELPAPENVERRSLRLNPRGQCHDLSPLLNEARRMVEPSAAAKVPALGSQLELFGDVPTTVPEVRITWAPRRRTKRRQRGIKLGSYSPTSAHGPLIRVHPLLDRADIDRWYVGFVVFHELLHHVIGVEQRDKNGRRILHPPEFRRRERAHPRYADAMAFESKRLWEIIRAG